MQAGRILLQVVRGLQEPSSSSDMQALIQPAGSGLEPGVSVPTAVMKCQACLAHLIWICSQPGLSKGTAAGMHG